MIICHCQSITDHDVRAAVGWMRASDCDTIITAGKVFRALGKRADCGGCAALFVATMRDAPGFAVPTANGVQASDVPAELTGLRRSTA
ncbi:(2Fe-2S)-binding protein [Paracoccus suum]|uniref:(2Fe-2S)-binding protein n=1 Tax=Paracoccus suum TaxID=2259340 RepID=A0A344PLZ9_9RHOB|nr:(2Fe-2S)-binding protein [Paracoccus suum]AXC50404.1 (2Fe-2S)-binding protein [Paracoccus suum]